MSKNAKKVIVINGDDQHTVKFYGKPTREELEETICAAAELPAGTRFKLLDTDGDPVVLSSAIPNNIKLKLEVLPAPGEAKGKKRRAQSPSNPNGQAGSRKKLRSAHQEGITNSFWAGWNSHRKLQPAPSFRAACVVRLRVCVNFGWPLPRR